MIVEYASHVYGNGMTRTYAHCVGYCHICIEVAVDEIAQIVVYGEHVHRSSELRLVGIDGGVRFLLRHDEGVTGQRRRAVAGSLFYECVIDAQIGATEIEHAGVPQLEFVHLHSTVLTVFGRHLNGVSNLLQLV